MAYLFSDGFGATATADLPLTYLVGGTPAVGAYGPGGRNALRVNASSSIGWVLDALYTELVMGVRLYIEDSFNAHLCAVADGSTSGGGMFFALHANSDGSIRVQAGATSFSTLGSAGTELWTSAPGVLRIATWTTLEWKATFGASGGTFTLRVNGEELCDLTGLATMPAPNAGVSIAYLGCNANTIRYTDWWVLDQAGDAPNDFLGDRVVEDQVAALGTGTRAEWTPSSGSDHGAMVDDATSDGDTTYNGADAEGLRDSYTFPALTLVEAVDAAAIALTARREGYGSRAIAGLTVIGGTDYVDPVDHYLTGSYVTVRARLPVDPSTDLPWASTAALEAAELGAQVTV